MIERSPHELMFDLVFRLLISRCKCVYSVSSLSRWDYVREEEVETRLLCSREDEYRSLRRDRVFEMTVIITLYHEMRNVSSTVVCTTVTSLSPTREVVSAVKPFAHMFTCLLCSDRCRGLRRDDACKSNYNRYRDSLPSCEPEHIEVGIENLS